jgi:hypothetical protein
MTTRIGAPSPASSLGVAEARTGPSGGARRRLYPQPAEWILLAYLVVVAAVTVLGYSLGPSLIHALASTPDDIASARLWSLLTSGLLVEGPLAPQIVATAVFGVLAIRLAGGRVFWVAAILAHILGTLLVYAGVWIADAQNPSAVAALTSEADFGISLVWCAALGVLASTAWWRVRPLPPWARLVAAAGAPAVLVVVTLFSDGLARYEHAAAFLVAVGVVYAARRWTSVDRPLRPGGDAVE